MHVTGQEAGPPAAGGPGARLVVLVSGTGTNLQALIDAAAGPGFGARVAAVGADRDGIPALERAAAARIPSFVVKLGDYASRGEWDDALRQQVAAHHPDLVVCAGFMKLLGKGFLAAFKNRCVNTHPALLPSFPGMHGVRDALAYGVKVSGCTVFIVDEGVDAGPIIAQQAVPVAAGDDEASLHERIKVAERALLVQAIGSMAREGWAIDGTRKVRIGS